MWRTAKPICAARHLYVELANSLGMLNDEAPLLERRNIFSPGLARFHGIDILVAEGFFQDQSAGRSSRTARQCKLTARFAINGQDCISAVLAALDVVLMDADARSADGYTATRHRCEIRQACGSTHHRLTANARSEAQLAVRGGVRILIRSPLPSVRISSHQRRPPAGFWQYLPTSGDRVQTGNTSVDALLQPGVPGIDVAFGSSPRAAGCRLSALTPPRHPRLVFEPDFRSVPGPSTISAPVPLRAHVPARLHLAPST